VVRGKKKENIGWGPSRLGKGKKIGFFRGARHYVGGGYVRFFGTKERKEKKKGRGGGGGEKRRSKGLVNGVLGPSSKKYAPKITGVALGGVGGGKRKARRLKE